MPGPSFTSLALTFAVGLAGGVVGAWGVLQGRPEPPGGGGGGPVPAAGTVQVLAPTRPDGVSKLVRAVRGAVVNIDTEARREVPVDPFSFFGDGPQAPRFQVAKGVGSGFVLREGGLIATNHHVVRGADRLTVTFQDGRRLEGRVIGSDPATDLALVRVAARGLPTLALADPAGLEVGQYVVAMGSPLGLSQSVSLGILSATNRDIPINARVGFLQTDAPINPGNSGGPLLDLQGRVIGVNTAVAASAQGIGFAIPVETLRRVLPQLEASGRVEHAWLGVRVADRPEAGVVVAGVERGSPAAQAGLRPGDVVAKLNGVRVDDSAALIRALSRLEVGSRVELGLVRDGRPQAVALTLGRLPERAAAPPADE